MQNILQNQDRTDFLDTKPAFSGNVSTVYFIEKLFGKINDIEIVKDPPLCVGVNILKWPLLEY